MAGKLIWGRDLYKGFKLDKNTLLSQVDDILPFQMLTLEEKTDDWVKAVADYYEVCGWNNVEKKAGKIQRNYWMRHGVLNPSDYLTVPDENTYYQAVGWLMPPEHQSPLQMFYPIAPNFIDIMRGEFVKMDNTFTVEAIDPQSKGEVFSFKENQFRAILQQQAAIEKQAAYARIGAGPQQDPQEVQQQMQQLQQQMMQAELQARNFRTTGLMWAEKVLNIQQKRYELAELEPDGFESGLITDSEFWHIDLLDDDFKLELLNPKWCDYHKGPNKKYVSMGDYFLWFDFGSAGDVVNTFGRRMKEEDILKLKDVYVKSTNMIVPDYLKSHQGSYYDLSRNWLQATDMDPKMNDALLGKELAYNFMRSPNFDHNQEVDILNPIWGRRITGHPQMFRIMRLYWRSMRRIGWLTKIDRDGTIHQPDWVDENYKVTVEPEYDTSVNKEKTKDNLIYGEHIDWTWGPEWRHVVKIAPNQKHTFWLNSPNSFEAIYIDGGPVKFQFKGKKNPFDSLPPVEGCIYSYINMSGHSFIDRVKPFQILYNICMNKVPKKFLDDFGNKIAVHKALMPTNNLKNNMGQITTPQEQLEDKLHESPIFDFSYDPEMARGFGQPPLPAVLPLGTVQEAQYYMQVAQAIKWEAGELVGITRQKAAGARASETATSIQAGVQYSEDQLQKYFEQHGNLMERVRQRMLDAAQYYSTFQPSARDTYMNESSENVWLDVEGMDNTFRHYNIYLTSRADTRNALNTITQFLQNNNTVDIQASSWINALVEKSVPKLNELIRQGELEKQQQEQIQRDHELQMEQERRQTILAQTQQQQQYTGTQNELDRQNKIDVALINATKGAEGAPPQDNSGQQTMDNQFRQQQEDNKTRLQQQAQDDKRQHDMDKLAVEREKAEKDVEKEKIRLKAAQAKSKGSKK